MAALVLDAAGILEVAGSMSDTALTIAKVALVFVTLGLTVTAVTSFAADFLPASRKTSWNGPVRGLG